MVVVRETAETLTNKERHNNVLQDIQHAQMRFTDLNDVSAAGTQSGLGLAQKTPDTVTTSTITPQTENTPFNSQIK